MWVCHFYNIGTKYHFDTVDLAYAYGKNAGFQHSVYFEE
jgi:hypothetical protein